MPQRTPTIGSLPEAFGMVKAMRALAGIIPGRMAEDVDQWFDGPDGRSGSDRRNGTYRRRLLCGLGDIEPGCRGPGATAPPPFRGTARAAPARSPFAAAGESF